MMQSCEPFLKLNEMVFIQLRLSSIAAMAIFEDVLESTGLRVADTAILKSRFDAGYRQRLLAKPTRKFSRK